MPKHCALLKKKNTPSYLRLISIGPFNAFSYFQEPSIISLTTQSNHSHFLLFSLPLKCFRSITPSFAFLYYFNFHCFLSEFYNGSCDHIHQSPFLSLQRSALTGDDGRQPLFWPSSLRPFNGAAAPQSHMRVKAQCDPHSHGLRVKAAARSGS